MKINFIPEPEGALPGSYWAMTVPADEYEIEDMLFDLATDRGLLSRMRSYTFLVNDPPILGKYLAKRFPEHSYRQEHSYRLEILREDLLETPIFAVCEVHRAFPERDPKLPHLHYVANFRLLPDPARQARMEAILAELKAR